MREIRFTYNVKELSTCVRTLITVPLADDPRHFNDAADVVTRTCSETKFGATISFDKETFTVSIVTGLGPNAPLMANGDKIVQLLDVKSCLSYMLTDSNVIDEIRSRLQDKELIPYYCSLVHYCVGHVDSTKPLVFPVDVGARNHDDLVKSWDVCQEKAADGEALVASLSAPIQMKTALPRLQSDNGPTFAARYAVWLPNISKVLEDKGMKHDAGAYNELDTIAGRLGVTNIFDLNDKIGQVEYKSTGTMRAIDFSYSVDILAPIAVAVITVYMADSNKHFATAARIETRGRSLDDIATTGAAAHFNGDSLEVTIITGIGSNGAVLRDGDKVNQLIDAKSNLISMFKSGKAYKQILEGCKDEDLADYYLSLCTYCLNHADSKTTLTFPVDVGVRNYESLVKSWNRCKEKASNADAFIDSLSTSVNRHSVTQLLKSKGGGMFAAEFALRLPNIRNYLSKNDIKGNAQAFRDLDHLAYSLGATDIFDLNDKIKDLE